MKKTSTFVARLLLKLLLYQKCLYFFGIGMVVDFSCGKSQEKVNQAKNVVKISRFKNDDPILYLNVLSKTAFVNTITLLDASSIHIYLLISTRFLTFIFL